MRAFFEECLDEVRALAEKSPASVVALAVAALSVVVPYVMPPSWLWGLSPSIEVLVRIFFRSILCAAGLLVIFDVLGWPGNRWWRAAVALGLTAVAYFFVYHFDAAPDQALRLHRFALNLLLLLLFVLAQARQGTGKLLVLAQNAVLFGALFLLFCVIFGVFTFTADWLFAVRGLDRLWRRGIILAALVLFLLFLARVAQMGPEKADAISADKKYQLLHGILYYSSFAYAVLVTCYCLSWLAGTGQSHPSVVHLVIWSSSFSLLLFWLKRGAWRALDRAFLLLTGLLCACALGAVCLRIRQYGLTPNRYFVFVAALWLVFSCAWCFWRRDCRVALAVLVPLVLLGVWTPLGAIDMSVQSQAKRLAALEKSQANRQRMAELAAFLDRYGQAGKIPAAVSAFLAQPALIEVHASLARTRERGILLHIKPYEYALMDLGGDGGREYTDGAVRVRTSPDGGLSVFYQDLVQAELDLGRILRESLPVEEEKSFYSYDIAPEKRWIKVQGPDLDIAVYVEDAFLAWRHPAGAPKAVKDLETRLEYSLFLAKRRGT